MNREFVLLDEGNMIVSDHNGVLEKRYYGHGAQGELLSENKKELIDNKLRDAKKKLEEDKKVKKLSQFMIKFQPIFIISVTAIGFLCGGVKDISNFYASAIQSSAYALAGSSVVGGLSAIYWAVLKKIYKNKLKVDGIKIDTIRKIKNDYEKEENRLKENEYVRKGIYPNQIFSLINDTKVIEDNLDDQIETEYDATLKNSGLRLGLKRK